MFPFVRHLTHVYMPLEDFRIRPSARSLDSCEIKMLTLASDVFASFRIENATIDDACVSLRKFRCVRLVSVKNLAKLLGKEQEPDDACIDRLMIYNCTVNNNSFRLPAS